MAAYAWHRLALLENIDNPLNSDSFFDSDYLVNSLLVVIALHLVAANLQQACHIFAANSHWHIIHWLPTVCTHWYIFDWLPVVHPILDPQHASNTQSRTTWRQLYGPQTSGMMCACEDAGCSEMVVLPLPPAPLAGVEDLVLFLLLS